MGMFLSVIDGFRISATKCADLQIEGDVPQVEVDLAILGIGLGPHVGMGKEYFQDLVVGMVVVPAPDGVIYKRLDIQSLGSGHDLRLTPDPSQCLHSINEVTQAIPRVALLATPGGRWDSFDSSW